MHTQTLKNLGVNVNFNNPSSCACKKRKKKIFPFSQLFGGSVPQSHSTNKTISADSGSCEAGAPNTRWGPVLEGCSGEGCEVSVPSLLSHPTQMSDSASWVSSHRDEESPLKAPVLTLTPETQKGASRGAESLSLWSPTR